MSEALRDRWIVQEDAEESRLDRHLADHFPRLSRTHVQEWIKAGVVLVDGICRKASWRVEPGMEIALAVESVPEAEIPSRAIPQDIPLSIVYEDERVVVIDKPAGLTVHPGAGCPDGTLANALAFRYSRLSGLNGAARPGIVHRLDRDTSGLLVVALRDDAHRHLAAQLADKSLGRTYHAMVWGQPNDERIEAPIGRHPTDRIRMAVVPGGRTAATNVRVLQAGAPASLVECCLETGRTHQIRVHMAYRGCPVIGDPVYGGAQDYMTTVPPMERAQGRQILSNVARQALHARRLRLIHPGSGKTMEFESPWPDDFAACVRHAFPGNATELSGL